MMFSNNTNSTSSDLSLSSSEHIPGKKRKAVDPIDSNSSSHNNANINLNNTVTTATEIKSMDLDHNSSEYDHLRNQVANALKLASEANNKADRALQLLNQYMSYGMPIPNVSAAITTSSNNNNNNINNNNNNNNNDESMDSTDFQPAKNINSDDNNHSNTPTTNPPITKPPPDNTKKVTTIEQLIAIGTGNPGAPTDISGMTRWRYERKYRTLMDLGLINNNSKGELMKIEKSLTAAQKKLYYEKTSKKALKAKKESMNNPNANNNSIITNATISTTNTPNLSNSPAVPSMTP